MRWIAIAALAAASAAHADTAGAGLHLGGSSGHETSVGVDLTYPRPVWVRLSAVAYAGCASVTGHDEHGPDASGHRFGALAGLRVDFAADDSRLRPFFRAGLGYGSTAFD